MPTTTTTTLISLSRQRTDDSFARLSEPAMQKTPKFRRRQRLQSSGVNVHRKSAIARGCTHCCHVTLLNSAEHSAASCNSTSKPGCFLRRAHLATRLKRLNVHMAPDTRSISPHFGKVLQALAVIFLVNSGPHPEFSKECHHLPHGQSRHFSGLAQRHLALAVLFYGKQHPTARHQVTHRLGQIAPLLPADCIEELVILPVHADTHRFGHAYSSSLRFASSRIELL